MNNNFIFTAAAIRNKRNLDIFLDCKKLEAKIKVSSKQKIPCSQFPWTEQIAAFMRCHNIKV